MRLGNRIKKIEKDLATIRATRGQLRIVVCEYGETEAEALAKAGITDPDAEDLICYIVKWSDGAEHQYPLHKSKPENSLAGIDSELQQLQSELKKETQQ